MVRVHEDMYLVRKSKGEKGRKASRIAPQKHRALKDMRKEKPAEKKVTESVGKNRGRMLKHMRECF